MFVSKTIAKRTPSWGLRMLMGGGLLFALLGGTGCSSDDAQDDGEDLVCPEAADQGCSVVLAPGADDTDAVGSALADARAGQTLCLCPGTYRFTRELGLTTPNVTVKGLGATPEAVVWDFSQQDADNGMDVTADGFTIENLWLKNTPGNGIVVTGAEDVIFRKLKVSWDAGSVTENGAYAVYPVKSRRVIIEDTEVIGAADAGIYVGQCSDAIVRRNKTHGNVAGIEIENTTNSEVYDNETYDNTAGLLVFVELNLEKKDGRRARIYDNAIHDNNRPNFAEEGTLVRDVPAGTGVLILAAHETELHDNVITGNQSAGVVVVSHVTLGVVRGNPSTDLETDQYPRKTYLHGNTFTNNGTAPQDILAVVQTAANGGTAPLESVVWDGALEGESEATLCLGTAAQPSFRNFKGLAGIGDPSLQTTNVRPHACDMPSLPPLSF